MSGLLRSAKLGGVSTMGNLRLCYQEIIEFWFDEIDRKDWWAKDVKFDRMIADRFASIHAAARKCELYRWRESALGRLAEIIVLDQFSRNLFRDDARAFSNDSLALALAQEAIHVGANKTLDFNQKAFLYMPYMHSESPHIHKIAVELYSEPGLEFNFDFELKHKIIIDQFGRYPHRNKVLKRQPTMAEIEFLKGAGSSF